MQSGRGTLLDTNVTRDFDYYIADRDFELHNTSRPWYDKWGGSTAQVEAGSSSSDTARLDFEMQVKRVLIHKVRNIRRLRSTLLKYEFE